MSEVAVKIYETRKEIVRYMMPNPLSGKDGVKQPLTLIDVDSKTPVREIRWSRIGLYEVQVFFHGEDIKEVFTDGLWNEKLVHVCDMLLASNELCYMHKRTFYNPAPHVQDLSGLALVFHNEDSVLQDFYLTIRFLDE